MYKLAHLQMIIFKFNAFWLTYFTSLQPLAFANNAVWFEL